jgi:adenylylsulfate kinase
MIVGTPVYSISERRMMALSYAELSRHIYRAGTDVLCSAISPFADLRERNRVAFPRYCEILLDTPTEILRARDRKGVYENANGVGCSNVVGVDQQFEQSMSPPHYVVSNRGGKKQLRQTAEQIAAAWSRGASESP